MSNVRTVRLVFLDLETTTTEPNDPVAAILEVGLTVTDIAGRVVSEKNFVNWMPDYHRERVTGWDEVVLRMHTKNDLLFEVLNQHEDYDLQEEILEWMNTREFADDNPSHPKPEDEIYQLAGSGVSHFDRRWLRAELPRVSDRFTHWAIDVGSDRRMLEWHAPELMWGFHEHHKTHRALMCNKDAIRMYQNMVSVIHDAKVHNQHRQFGSGQTGAYAIGSIPPPPTEE